MLFYRKEKQRNSTFCNAFKLNNATSFIKAIQEFSITLISFTPLSILNLRKSRNYYFCLALRFTEPYPELGLCKKVTSIPK